MLEISSFYGKQGWWSYHEFLSELICLSFGRVKWAILKWLKKDLWRRLKFYPQCLSHIHIYCSGTLSTFYTYLPKMKKSEYFSPFYFKAFSYLLTQGKCYLEICKCIEKPHSIRAYIILIVYSYHQNVKEYNLCACKKIWIILKIFENITGQSQRPFNILKLDF